MGGAGYARHLMDNTYRSSFMKYSMTTALVILALALSACSSPKGNAGSGYTEGANDTGNTGPTRIETVRIR